MKKRIAALMVFCILAPSTASAAILFDSTNAAAKIAGYSFIWHSTGTNCDATLPTDTEYISYSFVYASSSSVTFDTVNVRTISAVSASLCLLWQNEIGASGYRCGSVTASAPAAATTTITFPSGERPYTLIADETLFFQFYDATALAADTAVSAVPKQEAGFAEIIEQTQYCGDAEDYTTYDLPAVTYGVPAMQFVGTASEALTPPNPEDYGLTGTSTAATQDFGFIGNMLRDVFVWLFQPPASVSAAYENEKNTLAGKAPWGWWTQISEGFASVSSTQAATTTALTMQIPHSGVTTTVAIFDTSAITAKIPENVLSLIRTLGGVAIWMLFGGWIWIIVTGNKPDESDV